MKLASPLKYHGGKSYLATKIVAMMPPHTNYVEPFAGGLSVLLAKDPEGVSEVVNDTDTRLTNFWRVLADEEAFAQFARRVEAVPVGELGWHHAAGALEEWERGGWHSERPSVVAAAAFFVHCRQSLAGRMKAFTAITRVRTRRGMNAEASAWLSAVEGLPAVHARLKRVVVLSRDALDVIRQQDGPDTLYYLDPPYLPETRASAEVYAHEMTADQHRALLGALVDIKGKFLLSGYRSGMYDEFAQRVGWRRADFDLPNNAAGGDEKRRMVECLWTNFEHGAPA